MATTNDTAAQLAALQATVADLQDQVTHLFSLHGPARWRHIQKQRADNVKAQGNPSTHPATKAYGAAVYRPKSREV
jgi:hypothetical protein